MTPEDKRNNPAGEAPENPAPGGAGPQPEKSAADGVLPKKASEDDPRGWGDQDEDHDAWLKEQKPPHWG